MGTRNRARPPKGGKAWGSRSSAVEPAGVAPAVVPAIEAAAATEEAPAAIRKGIYLSALVYIEGDQAPADNFSAPAKSALQDTLTKAFAGENGGFTMTLKKIEAQTGIEEDEEEEPATPKEEEKFEF